MNVQAPDGAAVLEADASGWIVVEHMWSADDTISVNFCPKIEVCPDRKPAQRSQFWGRAPLFERIIIRRLSSFTPPA